MKLLKIVLISVLALFALVMLLQIVASETGEVVVLTTRDSGGEAETRLWVIDQDGAQYLRAQPGSGWYGRLAAAPAVSMERDGVKSAYVAETRPTEGSAVNDAMRAKYGWRDVIIELLLGGRADAVAVRLNPAG